jgi:aspartate-semialdehyde dehydrogenase
MPTPMAGNLLSSLRIGVVGATGAVGRVTLELLRERGYEQIFPFGSWRSVGTTIGGLEVEEAAPKTLAAADLDICFFSVGSALSRELVPPTAASGALCIDKSSAFRLEEGVPLVVPEVNGQRAQAHDGIVANPNCCTIPLTMVLAPLHEAAGLERVRVATYQSVSGAGAQAMEALRTEPPERHDLRMDWALEDDELEEEAKIRAETRKILELPDLPLSASCVRVPVMVGHAEAVWIETREHLKPADAERILRAAPGLRYEPLPSPAKAAGTDDVLVGRIRRDTAVENGLVLFLACDNLRKGAALNAVQIADLVVRASLPASFGARTA